MKQVTGRIWKAVTAAHVGWYRRTGGRWAGARSERGPVLLLTTKGRRSGRDRTTPLMYVRSGDAYVVAGSAGGNERHPAWYLNLRSNSSVTIQVGSDVMPGQARIAEGEERDRLWQAFTDLSSQFARYQERTPRTIPVVLVDTR